MPRLSDRAWAVIRRVGDTSPTVAAIQAHYAAGRESWDSAGINVSQAGTACDRALWLSLHWASPEAAKDGKRVRLLKRGDIEEQWVVHDLRAIGLDVRARTSDGGRWSVGFLGGHVNGRLDGKVLGVLEAPKTDHVLEVKTHKETSFKKLVSKGLRVANPEHWAACQLYMHGQGMTRCFYIAVNKNDDSMQVERVKYDGAFCIELLAKLERIVTAASAPPRISEDPASFACRFCDHVAVCHRQALGRNTCRSCIHSTAVPTGGWHCTRHDRWLSREEQQAGCPNHLFHPDVVPGTQVDADPDRETVTYQMEDGTTWTDGTKEAAATGTAP